MTDHGPSLPRRALGRARRWVTDHGATIAQLEAELREERARVDRLETEIDELRRDSLRVAELLDLAEQVFTPGSDPAHQAAVAKERLAERGEDPEAGLPA